MEFQYFSKALVSPVLSSPRPFYLVFVIEIQKFRKVTFLGILQLLTNNNMDIVIHTFQNIHIFYIILIFVT